MDGILSLDKPAGITSLDAVTRVKHALGVPKAGHAGTLDPAATGVLLVCLGRATKLFDRLQLHDKEYHATVTLGVETDTYDAAGRVVARGPVPRLGAAGLEAALGPFRGEIRQVPPMYSALKHRGRPLYERARAGETVERAPRTVTVRELELLGFVPPDLTLRIVCTRGTYVRSLAHDLGRALGCGAHLTALRRTRSGPYRDRVALTLAAVEADPEAARARVEAVP
ncbi:MAG: tRNA pseudouridine(55) synthase TruB [Planctomycetota bacterium]